MLTDKPIQVSEADELAQSSILHLFQQSQMASRAMLAGRLGQTFDGNRDLYKTFGYLQSPGYNDYKGLFDRHGISTRIVEKFAEDTWNKPAIIIDGDARSDKPDDKPTPFITEWVALAKRLRVWQMFKQADVMLGYSRYSVLFLGAPGLDFKDPAGNGNLAYLSAFDESMATFASYITDTTSPLFGMPAAYNIAFNAIDQGAPAPEGSNVHHSRVLHITENRLASRLYGRPRLQNIINDLFDLLKTVGSGAEASWLTVFMGMLFTAKENADLPAKDSPEARYLDEQIVNFINKVQRYAVLDSVDVHDMGGRSVSIRDTFDVIIEAICGAVGISQRILLGSERGQLASEQDKTEWNNIITSRRTNFAEPDVLDPFITWCVTHKVITPPASGKWKTEWEEVFPMSLSEKADYGSKLATGATTITGGMPEAALDVNEWRHAVGLQARTDEEQARIDQEIAAEEDAKRKQELAKLELIQKSKQGAPAPRNGKSSQVGGKVPARTSSQEMPIKQNGLTHAIEKLGQLLRRNYFRDHEGRPGMIGGSLPRDAGAATDWQGRPLKVNRIITGGTLTAEEVALIDMTMNSSRRFRGKDVDSVALDTFKRTGLVMPVTKLLKTADQYYELTGQGIEIRNQLFLIRQRKARELEQNSFEDHRGRPGQRGGSLPRDAAGGGTLPADNKSAKDIYELLKSHPYGFSYRPADKTSPTSGYMSSISDGPIFDPEISREEGIQIIQKFLDEKADLLSGENRFVGGWLEKGQFYLDASQNYQDELEVMKAAGSSHQIGVFDVNNVDTIYVDKWLDSHPDFDAGPGVREWYKDHPS